MCYRTATAKNVTLHQYLSGMKVVEEYEEYWQVSGHSHPFLPVATMQEPGKVQQIQWGLTPFWMNPKENYMEFSKNEGQTLNTQAEHAFKWAPKFPRLLRQERALTFIEGFFEFRHEQYPEKKNGLKTAYYIYHADKIPLALPSVLWYWENDQGEEVNTVSLLTTKANELMRFIHNTKERMPAVMDMEHWEQWLDPKQKYVAPGPYRDGGLQSHKVANFLKKGMDQNCPEVQQPLVETTQSGLF